MPMQDSFLSKPLRLRTITAGVELRELAALERIESAIGVLKRARQRFADEGYEVQTLRVALNPVIAELDPPAREASLVALHAIDALAATHDVIVSLGPVLTEDREDPALPAWTTELVKQTRTISFSIAIASASGVHSHAARVAAQTMIELSRAHPGGVANFRFAAAASIPAGTPFFPVAWHRGPESLAVGLESASVVADACAGMAGNEDATARIRTLFNRVLKPIADSGADLARSERRTWLGIDASPAPLKDRSIAGAIETITKLTFGSPSTLQACASITAAIKSLDVDTCGYSGLMLPVLEDPVLAMRAGEGRFSIRDLLLYSSVCGTGLDVVPIPGDTPQSMIAGLLSDVAALSHRLSKPLSARLFLVPGKQPGDLARFDDPVLVDCAVMTVA